MPLVVPLLLVLADLTLPSVGNGRSPDPVAACVATGVTVTVAAAWALVLTRFPRHPAGWALVVVAVSQSASRLAIDYGTAATASPAPFPFERAAVWMAGWVWVPGYALIATVLPALVPHGVPARRWDRMALRLGVAATVVTSALWASSSYTGRDAPPVPELPAGATNPLQLGFAADLLPASLAVLALAAVWCALTVVRRFLGARGLERQQLACVVGGVAATVGLLAVAFLLPERLNSLAVALAALPIPISIGVAVLAYRLWDVRVVLARSLLFSAMTVFVLIGYVAVVATVGGLLGQRAGAPLVATALVAVLFQPVRDKLQVTLNRRVYGDRDNPAAAVVRLSESLALSGTPSDVLQSTVITLHRSLRVLSVAVVADGLTLARSGPLRAGTNYRLTYAGDVVATLVVCWPDGAPWSSADSRLLDVLGPQLAQTVQAVVLDRELRLSRERLVLVSEQQRRQLRRDLHDDLGPQLAGIAMRLDCSRLLLAGSADADEALSDVANRIRATVRTVRSIGDDLRPPLLDDLGLGGATVELARQLSSPGLTVNTDQVGTLPGLSAAVELAAFRIIAESLTNVLRHASADHCEVALRTTEGRLELRISDNGVGINLLQQAPTHQGLASMEDRAAEIGGVLSVRHTRPGTEVSAQIPLHHLSDEVEASA